MRNLTKLVIFFSNFMVFQSAFSSDIARSIEDFKSAEDHILTRSGAFITQTGDGNQAIIVQSGAKIGSGNFADIAQNGTNNTATSLQTGDSNFTTLQQNGDFNGAIATQLGDANTIKLLQNLNFNNFSGVQQGNNNLFDVIQNGSSNVNLQAIGDNNTIRANMPNGKDYSISTTGSNLNISTTGQ